MFPTRCAHVCASVGERRTRLSHELLAVTEESRLWGHAGVSRTPLAIIIQTGSFPLSYANIFIFWTFSLFSSLILKKKEKSQNSFLPHTTKPQQIASLRSISVLQLGSEIHRQARNGKLLPLSALIGQDWSAPSCSQSLLRSRPPHPGQQVSWIKLQSAQRERGGRLAFC